MSTICVWNGEENLQLDGVLYQNSSKGVMNVAGCVVPAVLTAKDADYCTGSGQDLVT